MLFIVVADRPSVVSQPFVRSLFRLSFGLMFIVDGFLNQMGRWLAQQWFRQFSISHGMGEKFCRVILAYIYFSEAS